jgi:hypothetical protein
MSFMMCTMFILMRGDQLVSICQYFLWILICLYLHEKCIRFSGKSQRSNKFELRFRTEAENGLILWLSRGHSLQADYFALAIVHSRLELSFNLGKQSSFLSARSMVSCHV